MILNIPDINDFVRISSSVGVSGRSLIPEKFNVKIILGKLYSAQYDYSTARKMLKKALLMYRERERERERDSQKRLEILEKVKIKNSINCGSPLVGPALDD